MELPNTFLASAHGEGETQMKFVKEFHDILQKILFGKYVIIKMFRKFWNFLFYINL